MFILGLLSGPGKESESNVSPGRKLVGFENEGNEVGRELNHELPAVVVQRELQIQGVGRGIDAGEDIENLSDPWGGLEVLGVWDGDVGHVVEGLYPFGRRKRVRD